jgi:hypothetical protein
MEIGRRSKSNHPVAVFVETGTPGMHWDSVKFSVDTEPDSDEGDISIATLASNDARELAYFILDNTRRSAVDEAREKAAAKNAAAKKGAATRAATKKAAPANGDGPESLKSLFRF